MEEDESGKARPTSSLDRKYISYTSGEEKGHAEEESAGRVRQISLADSTSAAVENIQCEETIAGEKGCLPEVLDEEDILRDEDSIYRSASLRDGSHSSHQSDDTRTRRLDQPQGIDDPNAIQTISSPL